MSDRKADRGWGVIIKFPGKSRGEARVAAEVAEPVAASSTNFDRAAISGRAATMIGLLYAADRIGVEAGRRSTFNLDRAVSFLKSIERFDPADGDSDDFSQIIKWVSDHDLSLDWLFRNKSPVAASDSVVQS
jgi:hypothetical protein